MAGTDPRIKSADGHDVRDWRRPMIIGQGRCYYPQSCGQLNQNYTGFNTVYRAALLRPPTICWLVTDNTFGCS